MGRRPAQRLEYCARFRGKWGLAPWHKPVWHKQKRCRHGACPLFPQALPGPRRKRGQAPSPATLSRGASLFEATEPVPISDCRTCAVELGVGENGILKQVASFSTY